jgi:cytochrome c oxidase cbb3-type subunit 3/ubiquinol-cytochrome c reductase cytochrome c subunit
LKFRKYATRPALLMLLVSSIAGCDLPGKPKLDDQYVAPHKEMRFNVLFQENCVACHGVNGKLGPAPPLNDGLFLGLVPEPDLQRVISEGRAGTLMPAFALDNGGHLTADQVQVLAHGIKSNWGPAEPVPSGAPPLFPVPSKQKSAKQLPGEQVPSAPRLVEGESPRPEVQGTLAGNKEAGAMVFNRACGKCHGDHGEGTELAGAINNPNFLSLISDQALRRLVITGRADLGMPDYAGTKGRPENFQALTAENVTDIVALLASWRTESLNGKRN